MAAIQESNRETRMDVFLRSGGGWRWQNFIDPGLICRGARRPVTLKLHCQLSEFGVVAGEQFLRRLGLNRSIRRRGVQDLSGQQAAVKRQQNMTASTLEVAFAKKE